MIDPLNRPLGVPQRRYGNGRRVFYGGLWSLYTVVLTIACVYFLSAGSLAAAFFSAVIGFLTGVYAYRIWTWRARHLWILIIF